MKRAIVVLAALLSTSALADDWNICWTPPTHFCGDAECTTSGDPLMEQDLDFYTLYINDAVVMNFDAIVGTWCVVYTTHVEGTYTAHLTVTHINGKTSPLSNPASFTLGPRTPGAPINLTVTKL